MNKPEYPSMANQILSRCIFIINNIIIINVIITNVIIIVIITNIIKRTSTTITITKIQHQQQQQKQQLKQLKHQLQLTSCNYVRTNALLFSP